MTIFSKNVKNTNYLLNRHKKPKYEENHFFLNFLILLF